MALPQSGVDLVAQGEKQFLSALSRAEELLDAFSKQTQAAADQSQNLTGATAAASNQLNAFGNAANNALRIARLNDQLEIQHQQLRLAIADLDKYQTADQRATAQAQRKALAVDRLRASIANNTRQLEALKSATVETTQAEQKAVTTTLSFGSALTTASQRASGFAQTMSGQVVGSLQRIFEYTAGNLIAGGLERITSGFTGLVTGGIQLNGTLENVDAQLRAFTKDGELSARILAEIRREADSTPFAFQELASATSGLIPAAGQAQVSLMGLLETAEILAASNPAEGLEGAAFSLREAVSGDFTSVIERFNLPRQYINQLKEEGVPNIEIVRRAMQMMGYDIDLVANLSQTLSGRWSTFQDTLAGVQRIASAPLFDVLKEGLASLQAFFDQNKDRINAWANAVGQAIAQVARWAGGVLVQAGQTLASTWNAAMQNLEGGTARSLGRVAGIMAGVAKLAVSWGQNIVNALAQGIQMAIAAVIRALNFLGRIISGLLRPGSPPKLLPDLDEWGKGAADAWLEGWTKADFGALNHLGDMAGRIIQAQGGQQNPANIPMQMNTKQAIADAINEFRATGSVGEDAYKRIREAAGSAGARIEELTRRQIDLLAAQQKLNDITKAYDEQLNPLYDKLKEIQDAQTYEDEEARLAEIAALQNSIFTSEEEKARLAREAEEIRLRRQIRGLEDKRDVAVEGAEEEVDAAQAAYDQLEDRLATELAARDLKQQQSDILKNILSAQEGINDALGDMVAKIEDALSPLEKQLEINQLQQEEMRATVRLAEIDKELAKSGLTAAQRKTLELEKQRILLERQQRAMRAGELGIDLSGIINTPVVLADLEDITDKLGAGGIGGALADLASTGPNSLDWLSEEFAGAEEDVAGLFTELDKLTEEFSAGFAEGQAEWDKLREKIEGVDWGGVRGKIEEIAGIIGGLLVGLGAFSVLTTVAGWFATFQAAVAASGGVIAAIVAALGGPVTITLGIVAGAIALLTAAWIGNWGGIRDITLEVWNNYILPTWNALVGFVNTTVLPALQELRVWLADKFTEASNTVQEIWLTVLSPALNELNSFITDYLNPLLAALRDVLVEVARIGMEAIQLAWNSYLKPILTELHRRISEELNPIIKRMTDVLRDLGTYIQDTLHEIIKSFVQDRLQAFENVVKNIKKAVEKLIEWLEKLATALSAISIPDVLTPGSPTPFEKGLMGISQAAQQVNKDLTNMTGLFAELDTTISPSVNATTRVAPPASSSQMAAMANGGPSVQKNMTLNQYMIPQQVARESALNFTLLQRMG